MLNINNALCNKRKIQRVFLFLYNWTKKYGIMLLKVDLASRGGGAVLVDFWRVSSHNTVQEKTLFFVGFVCAVRRADVNTARNNATKKH